MGTTTRNDLANAAAKQTSIMITDCKSVLDLLLEMIPKLLTRPMNIDRSTVELRGFGVFHTRIRKARPARNPRTGKIVMLPRRRVLLWRPSPDLCRYVNHAPPTGVNPHDTHQS